MAIPENMIYDDDTTRMSDAAYVYTCIIIITIITIIITLYFCGVRHNIPNKKRFHRSDYLFIIYNIQKPF